jgi:hypothetical protein
VAGYMTGVRGAPSLLHEHACGDRAVLRRGWEIAPSPPLDSSYAAPLLAVGCWCWCWGVGVGVLVVGC